MTLENLKDSIPDFGRDIKLNLGTVLTEEGAPGLKLNQIWGVALSCAYQTKNAQVINAISTEAQAHTSPEEREAAKAAATIMAMNNIYYRFGHISEEPEFTKMPARLRMNVIGKPGIEKVDFELYCLAVSALNGCGACIKAHINEVKKGGIQNEGIHSSTRIASVVSAAAQAVTIASQAAAQPAV